MSDIQTHRTHSKLSLNHVSFFLLFTLLTLTFNLAGVYATTIVVGHKNPLREIAFDSHKNEIFVIDPFSNTVSVISDASNQIIAAITGFNGPESGVFDRGTSIVCPGSGNDSSGSFTCVTGLSIGAAIASIYKSVQPLGFEETLNISFDDAAAGFMIGHRSLAKTVFLVSDSERVNLSTGQLLFAPDYWNCVIVGGAGANPTTAFYEDNGFTPLRAQVSGGSVLFYEDLAQVYTVPLASVNSTSDYFVLQAFQAGAHTVVISYGIGAAGTLAAGVYFDAFLFPSLGNFTAEAYIVHWEGSVPNVPLPTDAYSIVYHT